MKTLLLLTAILSGILFPYGHDYTFLVRYFIMIMLLLAFLDIKINFKIVQKSHVIILSAKLLIAVAAFYIVNFIYPEAAPAALVTAIAPTAIASPVIISLLNRKVEYAAVSLIFTNIVLAFIIPFLFPALLSNELNISTSEVLFPVLSVTLIPLLLSKVIVKYIPAFHKFLSSRKDKSFYFLISNIYLGTAKATHFVQTELTSSTTVIFIIGITSLLLCIIFFSLGKAIGGKKYSDEAMQSLGQKNNGFTMWLGLEFINPLAAMGPVFYIFCQNIFISWQLHNNQKKNGPPPAPTAAGKRE